MATIPLTAADLRAIADFVELADDPSHDTVFGSAVVGRIEILRPDGIDDEVIGHLTPCDDWWGFVPLPAF